MLKKSTLFVLLLCVFTIQTKAQNFSCGFDTMRTMLNAIDNEQRAREQIFNFKVNQFRKENTVKILPTPLSPYNDGNSLVASPGCFSANYIIPVIVHVVYDASNPTSNISTGMITEQIRLLNEQFANYNNNTAGSVNTGIQFCLAPVGISNSGVFRYNDSALSHTNTSETHLLRALVDESLYAFDKFMHIFVVSALNKGGGKNYAGYAAHPSSPPSNQIGIVMRYQFMGDYDYYPSVCSTISKGKTLAHEVGHFLGLYHTFEGNCVGLNANTCQTEGDLCCDTPPTDGEQFGCNADNTCTNDVPDMPDQINNHLAYTNDVCRNMFTFNQVEIMYATLEGMRKELSSVSNLNTLNLPCCVNSAAFDADIKLHCKDGFTMFSALNYNNNTKYRWIIKKNNITIFDNTFTGVNTYSAFLSSVGIYSVTLFVIEGIDTFKQTKINYIEVRDCGSPIKSEQGNWFFGNRGGITFNTLGAIPNNAAVQGGSISGPSILSSETAVTQSNKDGGLLFYAGSRTIKDSLRIWDKEHNSTPRTQAQALKGSDDGVAGLLVLPHTTQGNKYLLVSIAQKPDSGFLYYRVIDTAANSGLADVVGRANIPVKVPNGCLSNLDTAVQVNESVIGAYGCDNSYHWLITLDGGRRNTNDRDSSLLFFKVQGDSIVFSHSIKLPNFPKVRTRLELSPDGTKLLCGTTVYNFNKKDGSISLICDFNFNSDAVYDQHYYPNYSYKKVFDDYRKTIVASSFSPNSRFLYYIRGPLLIPNAILLDTLFQLDLSKSNPTSFQRVIGIYPKGFFLGMQLAPNRKIYIVRPGENKMAVINNPDSLNTDFKPNNCGYAYNGALIGGSSTYFPPHFIDNVKDSILKKKISYKISNCFTYNFESNICCADNYIWNYGDNSPNDTSKYANHTFANKGTYIITLTYDNITLKDTIVVGNFNTKISGRNIFCDTLESYEYSALPRNNFFNYNWSVTNGRLLKNNNSNDMPIVFYDSGNVSVVVTDLTNGCHAYDTLFVKKQSNISNNIIYADSNLCLSDKLIINGTVPILESSSEPVKYYWQIGSLDSINWFDLPSENSQNLKISLRNAGIINRIVKVGYCNYFSNNIVVSTLNKDINKISKSYSSADTCASLLFGDNLSRYKNIQYQWQISSDSLSWTNISGATNQNFNSFVNDTLISYFRRIVYNESCTLNSNALTNRHIRLIQQPYLIKKCKDEFPLIIKYKFDLAKGYQPNLICEIKKNGGSIWKKFTIDFYTDTQLLLRKYINGIGYLDTINLGDSLRFSYKIVCGSNKVFYSDAILLDTLKHIYFTEHPVNQNVSSGSSVMFTSAINTSENCQYTWQSSLDGTSDWQDIKNSDNDTLFIQYANPCYQNSYFRVKATNSCFTASSNLAQLTLSNFSTPSFDYWMKNTNADVGYEPDTISSSFVISQDIWIRHNKDSIKQHQDINTQIDINYVYVTVRNRGTTPAPSAKLYTYWTWGGTQESWPKNWTYNNNNLYFNGTQYLPMGGEINKIGISIPEIPQNGSVDIAIPWRDFPEYGWYDLNKQWNSQRINICLLARIETCDIEPFIMTYPEQEDVLYNIKHNNNIISRNTYALPFKRSRSNGGNGVYRNINPNIIDGGTIVVRNNDEEARKSTICIKTIDVAYFDKAETYIEIGEALKAAIEWSPSVVYSGLTHVVDNIYQVSSANACFEDVVLPAHFQDAVLPLFAYKDINDRFPDGASFSAHIQQKDSLGYLVGECVFTLTDNLFVNPEPTYIEDDTALYICNSTNLDPEILTAEYVYSASFPYVVLDDNNDTITQTFNHTYNLNQGTYTFVTTDTINNTKYFTSVLVEVNNLNESFVTDTLPFDCELGYYGLNIYDNQTLVYDENDDLVTETSTNYYELDAVNHQYKTITTNLEICESLETTLHFIDEYYLPETIVATIYGDFNTETDTCAFFKVDELLCNGNAINSSPTIEVFDIAGIHLLTTAFVNHETRGNGFYFCPPYWNNEPEHIYDWYSLVIRTDFCDYCRFDFRYDSTGIYERSSSLTNATLIKNRVMLYPNPANQDVNIHILGVAETGLETITIQILDQTGRILEDKVHALNKDGIISLSIEQYANGVYFIKIPALKYDGKVVLIKK